MNIENKKQAFEYILNQMLCWNYEITHDSTYLSFTRLKALKLLFFVAAVKNDDEYDLLDVFDNFYALQNGPVESDIYNCITRDELDYYTFINFSINQKHPYNSSELPSELKCRIDAAVSTLKKINYNLVTYKAEQLVVLSHFWQSWQNAFQIAKALGKGSYRMDSLRIRNNTQFFSL